MASSTRASMSSPPAATPAADTKGSDVPLKRLYVRQFSNVLRKWSSYGELNMTENAVFNIIGPNRTIIMTICRIRQRILAQAWGIWAKQTNVKHDYENDLRAILSRKLPEGDLRTELEIEVLYKWMAQVKDIDPTGIASTIYNCKKKAVIYEALQQIRLEFFAPGDTVLFQGDIPRTEDGHFTIFRGECEVVQFPEESVPLLKLLYLAKKKKWDEARKLLNSGQVVAKIPRLSGFGELSTLTGVKRAATIRAARKLDHPTEILVLPKDALLDCLKSRLHDGVDGSAPSEAIDFLRQSGLANRISPKDLVTAAGCMIRRTLLQGDVLYYKGETVKSIFLVVSGEFLLDTADCIVDGELQPFVHSNIDKCCHLSSGSILGDEGVTGQNNVFESTAAVVSSAAVVFEAVGFGMRFLADKLGSLRYSALYYRDKLRFDDSYALAEQMNLYTYFNSLRKCIAYTKPFRGLSQSGNEKLPPRPKSASSHSRSPSPKSSPNRLYQKFIEDRNKALQQRDTRVSFFIESNMSADAASYDGSRPPSSNNSYADVNRVLVGLGLHRAIEFNKQAKKVLQSSIKIHAKDSILYEQLRKLPKEEEEDEAAIDAERIMAEKAFKKALKEYFERVADRNRRIKEEEEAERQRKLAKGGSAIKFFASTVSEDENDENDSPGKLSKQGSQTSIKSGSSAGLSKGASESSLTVRERQLEAGLSKMEQYFLWVDKLNRQNYRYLQQQAQVTADSLHDQQVHENSNASAADDASFSADSWKELAEVFQTYGLTPGDFNIPWELRAKSGDNRGASPKTPALPLERLNSGKGKGMSERNLLVDREEDEEKAAPHKVRHQAGGTFGTQRRSVIPVDSHGAAMLRDDRDAKMVGSKYKSYNPSSWRDDLIHKKAQELAAEIITFTRSDTPDNRRTLGIHIVVSSHDEEEERRKREEAEEEEIRRSDRSQKAAHENFAQFMKGINYEQYIDSPDYFMKIVMEMDIDQQRRVAVNTKPWQTRFMVIINDPDAKKKKITKECVRSHLKENLEHYSKSVLMENVQKLKDKQVTPFIRTINKEQWAPEEIAAISRKDSFFDNEGMKASFLAKSIRMSQSGTNPSNNPIQASLLQVREAMNNEFSTNGVNVDDKVENKLGITVDVDAKLPPIESSPNRGGTPKLAQSPKRKVQNLPDISAPPQRISDVKAPSKALQAFEEFLKSQQTGSNKAAVEGKKRANKTSKFKLRKTEDNYIDQVSFAQIHRMKLENELGVFKAMYPNAAKKQIDEFVLAFTSRYPDVKLGAEFQHLQEENLSLDFMSATSTTNSLASSQASYNSIEVGRAKLKRSSPQGTKKITFMDEADEVEDAESTTTSKKRDDFDPELELWQNFTIDSIVKSKVGERKTLPGVSCKALEKGLSGKRYRSNRAQRGGSGTLVTIPAKSTEEPIDGPPNYLDLYKTSFRLHTSSAEKAKVLEELRAKSVSNSRGGF